MQAIASMLVAVEIPTGIFSGTLQVRSNGVQQGWSLSPQDSQLFEGAATAVTINHGDGFKTFYCSFLRFFLCLFFSLATVLSVASLCLYDSPSINTVSALCKRRSTKVTTQAALGKISFHSLKFFVRAYNC